MSEVKALTKTAQLPRASAWETIGVVAGVIAPTIAKGVIVRRPAMVALAERLDLDRRAVRRLQRLRDRHGDGPLLLPLPVRRYALILAPADVRRVLDGSPAPFAAASDDKRAALAHFQPHGVLISRGEERTVRRAFNEAVLDTDRPAHRLAEPFLAVVAEEATALLAALPPGRPLAWDAFTDAWFRVARRVALGDGARDDRALTDLLARLRADGNWAFLRPQRRALRDRLHRRLAAHLARAEAGSLAAIIAAMPADDRAAPTHQLAHWLFAFDAAGIASFRALALLASHPAEAARAAEELRARDGAARRDLPFLRACVLDALRLWPTTPAVLRQSDAATDWPTGTLPARTGILIFAPYFHRDATRLPEADRFAPDLWLDGRAGDWPLIPFSAGPVACPGRNLVLLLTSAFLAALLDGRRARLLPPPRLDPRRPLPGTLDHFALRFALDH